MKLQLKCVLSAFLLMSMSSAAMAQNEGQGAPEIIKHKTNPHDMGGAPTEGSTGVVTPAITNHGGLPIGTPTIYYIWYGNWAQANGTDTAAGQQILVDFANAIGGSNYFKINITYSFGGVTVTGNATFGGQTSDNYSQGSRLRDATVQTIVTNAITSRRLPYDPTGVYFVLTSSDVSEQSGFCTKYCGWHTAGTSSVGRIRYSFVGNAARCLNGCAPQNVGPNGNAGVDGMVSIVAHELEEATSDPDLNAWYDSAGAENADKCAWSFGPTSQAPNGAYYNVTLGQRNYLIQRNLYHSTSGDTCKMDYLK